MLTHLEKPALSEAALAAALHPGLSTWFRQRFGAFSPAQRFAVPEVLAGRSTLLSSPTGSGKTLAAFLSVFDRLARLHDAGTLPGGVVALYVSPLRALAYDLQKNLRGPLAELGWDFVRVGARTGDTTQAERAAQKRKPPHILVTTPESLTLLLSQPSWVPMFRHTHYLIIDELHALAENKRGALLMLAAERLEELGRIANVDAASDPRPPLVRVGLSATVSPLTTMAQFLVGPDRACCIAEVTDRKPSKIEVFSPLRKNPYPPAGYTATRVLRELGGVLREKRTTLIFTNTRSGAEGIGLRLRQLLPDLTSRIEVHHASLDRTIRLDVEDRLKRGELRAVVCSTSLEMGIDIGTIDTVVMVSAPKGVARALQRIGRSGHSMGETSHGLLVATNINDLAECVVTARMMEHRELEPVKLHHNPLDVLAQHLVGLAVYANTTCDEAFALVRRSYPFRTLTRTDFDRVVRYLEGGGVSLERNYRGVFGKIVIDAEGHLTVPSPRIVRDLYQNIGTISADSMIQVKIGMRTIGQVEESFMKGMRPGDVFVLSGRTLRLVETRLLSAKVVEAKNALPTVPRWNAAKMPLASGLAREVVRLRTGVAERLSGGLAGLAKPASAGSNSTPAGRSGETQDADSGHAHAGIPQVAQLGLQAQPRGSTPQSPEPAGSGTALPHPGDPVGWLRSEYHLTAANAEAIVRHFALQAQVSAIPTAEFFLIECYPERDLRHYFFHALIGRAANDALSRMVAQRVQETRGGNALVTIDDYGFLLTLRDFQELDLDALRTLFRRDGAEAALRTALAEAPLVKWHFRGVSQTGLMVPRRVRGEERGARSLQWSSEIIFDVLRRHEPDHPLLVEAYAEATLRFLDTPRAVAFLDTVAGLRWDLRTMDRVSPFSFGIFVSKIKETMMLEDPETAIERLFHEMYGSLPEPVTPATGSG